MHSIVPCGFLEITKMQGQRPTYVGVGVRVRAQSVIARARAAAAVKYTSCLGHAPTRGACCEPEKTSSARLPDHSTTTKQRRDAFGDLQNLALDIGASRSVSLRALSCLTNLLTRLSRFSYRGLPKPRSNVHTLWGVSRAPRT